MVLPRVATPPRRPLCCFRNLVRLGRSIGASLIALLGSPPRGGTAFLATALSALSTTAWPATATTPRPLPAWAAVASLTAGRPRLLSCRHVILGRLWCYRRLRLPT